MSNYGITRCPVPFLERYKVELYKDAMVFLGV